MAELKKLSIGEIIALSDEERDKYLLQKYGLDKLSDKEFIDKFEKESIERTKRLSQDKR